MSIVLERMANLSLVEMLVLSLASYRLMRLIMLDDITVAIRGWVFDKVTPNGFIDSLLACPYCLSVWVSFGVFGLWAATPWANLVLIPLAIAGASTAIASNLDSHF